MYASWFIDDEHGGLELGGHLLGGPIAFCGRDQPHRGELHDATVHLLGERERRRRVDGPFGSGAIVLVRSSGAPPEEGVPMLPAPLFALLAALLAFAGCRSDTGEFTTSFDALATFPEKASFAWDAAACKLPDDPRIRELNLDPLIREAAEGAFTARGWQPAVGAAGYRLAYELGENRWHGPGGTTSVVSLSLFLTDAKNGRRVWSGYGRAEVQPNLSREERGKRLRAAFDRMLAAFPPRPAS
ncbi:MAG: DUF4136 domain-containing protein [Candidatus Rokuibacteriota bacterium]